MQREEVPQRLLVLGLAEARPARLEERVEPLGAGAADALIELGGAAVVAALVGEACELKPGAVAALDGRLVAALHRKLGQRQELLHGALVVAGRQRREAFDLERLGLQRIARRNRSRERPSAIQLAQRRFRRPRIFLLRRVLCSRCGMRALAHLGGQLLVERLHLGGRLQGRPLPLEVLEGDALLHRRELQRPLEVAACELQRQRRRQLAGIALLREQQLREARVLRSPRRQRRLGRVAHALGLRLVGGQHSEQHRRRARHPRPFESLHHRRDAAASFVGGQLRPIDAREGRLR